MSENLVQQEPITLGKDLPPVGPIAFGLWRYTTDKLGEATELLETAIELGMNLIDNADVYGFDGGGRRIWCMRRTVRPSLSCEPAFT